MNRNIKNRRVTVLGAKGSGLGAAELLSKHGAQVFVSEISAQGKMGNSASELKRIKVNYEFGGHSNEAYNCDYCIISPGISINSSVSEKFKEKQIPIYSELEAASWFCKGKIVAVTGSNGKSTVTTLIGEILKKAGKEAVVAGNIGTPFSKVVDSLGEQGYAVLEVSSFQLEAVSYFKPDIGVFLNLTPDHLDRHRTMESYGRLKARVFKNQAEEDIAVFNGDDIKVKNLISGIRGKKVEFGIENKRGRSGFVSNNILKCVVNSIEYPLVSVSEMGMKGIHNVLNSLAAALAGLSVSIKADVIKEVLKSFKGLPHRMEFVKEINGVKWYNDSKATNVDSVLYALKSFSEPVVLIAGGRDKDSDFSLLLSSAQKYVKKIIVIGEASEKIDRAIGKSVECVHADSIEKAVNLANYSAVKGDVVLLSPACASFDMFDNFEHRGEVFKNLVRALK